jgi:hypothetical protein
MYKQTKPIFEGGEVQAIQRISDSAFIPFDPANTDYANFKADILADKATLQDADGNTMTPEEAQAYIKELP